MENQELSRPIAVTRQTSEVRHWYFGRIVGAWNRDLAMKVGCVDRIPQIGLRPVHCGSVRSDNRLYTTTPSFSHKPRTDEFTSATEPERAVAETRFA